MKVAKKCNQLAAIITTTTRTERHKVHSQGQNDASAIYVFREISQIALYVHTNTNGVFGGGENYPRFPEERNVTDIPELIELPRLHSAQSSQWYGVSN